MFFGCHCFYSLKQVPTYFSCLGECHNAVFLLNHGGEQITIHFWMNCSFKPDGKTTHFSQQEVSGCDIPLCHSKRRKTTVCDVGSQMTFSGGWGL